MNIKFRNFYVKINWLFILLTILLLFCGEYRLYAVTFVFMFIHELCHIIVGRIFGIKCIGIRIYPIGFCAELNGLERTNIFKRILVFLSGPFFNFICGVVLWHSLVGKVNMVLCVFNLLPIYPLDGFSIFSNVIAYFCGTINGGRITTRFSKLLCYIILFIGLLQLVLFPFNMTILFIGMYAIQRAKEYELTITYSFYNSIYNKSGFIKVKQFKIDDNTTLKAMIDRIGVDYYSIFYNKKCAEKFLGEEELIYYIINYALEDKFVDIQENKGYN